MIGLFRARGSRAAAPPPAPADHQVHVLDLADAFGPHDAATLAGASPHLRASQLAARWDLWMFVERIWDEATQRGLDPAVDPRYGAVAALRDLMCALYETADEAQRAAGDLDY